MTLRLKAIDSTNAPPRPKVDMTVRSSEAIVDLSEASSIQPCLVFYLTIELTIKEEKLSRSNWNLTASMLLLAPFMSIYDIEVVLSEHSPSKFEGRLSHAIGGPWYSRFGGRLRSPNHFV